MPELAVRLGSLIGDGVEQLRRAGIPDPRRQTLRLWTDLSGENPAQAILDTQLEIEPSRVAAFRLATQRRAEGEPLQHITGRAGFRHLTLWVDRRALIPRPETEGLVELLLQRVRTGVIADLGTGSGCIALSLATEGAFRRVVGVDCSGEAIALARINAERIGVAGAVTFVRADLGTALRSETFDALISNPPYLTLNEYCALDRSVRDWEPEVALSSGTDGLEATTRLLDQGRDLLQSGGWLALEVDSTRAGAVARAASDYGWCDVSIHMDLFGRERYLLARRSDRR